ncbi:MAG: fimbrillin family protein [Phocaeicola sp.]|uniref:fimbrillin family protein n=1 Tax=Phocaeicola sp. TaxID=2773926 RepID=UPI003F9F47AF
MKVRRLLFLTLCLVSMGMFVSCDTNEELEVLGGTPPQPHKVSITVSTDANEASTRVSMDAGYKMTWEDGDKLSVVYTIDGTNYDDKFILESKSVDGKTGTFTCASSNLPTDGNTTVGVFYPYREIQNSYHYPIFRILYANHDVRTDDLEGMGHYAVMYAVNLTAVKGQLPKNITLSEKGVCFLHIPAGLTLFTGADGTLSVCSESIHINGPCFVVYMPTQFYFTDYKNSCGAVVFGSYYQASVVNGVLQRDIYVPFFPTATKNEAVVEISIIDNKNNTHKFKWTLPGRNYTAGKIYKVNATVMPAKAFI